jgi:hypothetical protein
MAHKKTIHESFAKFFEKPTRDRLRELLKNNVGELDNLDFKESFPEKEKLAKHILAIANSKGGVIIVGQKKGDRFILILSHTLSGSRVFRGYWTYLIIVIL